jgi:hypothetical protein
MLARKTWLLLAFAVGCTTYREDLNRGQRLYEENQYEKALAIWRELEIDRDSLNVNDQARYAYLRGMTGYRLGYREDARHWLALARATEQRVPGGLSPEWKERLAKSLGELNQEVYGEGANIDGVEAPAEKPAADPLGSVPTAADVAPGPAATPAP